MTKSAWGISPRTLAINARCWAPSIDALPTLMIVISQFAGAQHVSSGAPGRTAFTISPIASAQVSSKRVMLAWRNLFESIIRSSGFFARAGEVHIDQPPHPRTLLQPAARGACRKKHSFPDEERGVHVPPPSGPRLSVPREAASLYSHSLTVGPIPTN